MSPKQQALALIKEMNVEIDFIPTRIEHDAEISVTAPQGYKFVSSDSHALQTAIMTFKNEKAVMWRVFLKDIKQGLEPCDDDCECRS